MNYYNEHDPFAAAWLRRLIEADLIPAGDVDERSIEDVTPNDVAIYTSCHWFAGIGGWPYALRLAGWPDDRPVWTGSAPCQPFSAAGKGGGFTDERHLWPAWFWLIRQCRPATIFGEQVSSAAGLDWFATVSADLEAAGYAIGAADLCAAGIGAPHIRQRLYFVADAECGTAERWRYDMDTTPTDVEGKAQERQWIRHEFGSGGHVIPLADAESNNQRRIRQSEAGNGWGKLQDRGHGAFDILADTDQQQRNRGRQSGARGRRESANGGAWGDLEWLPCTDGKARPTQPGLLPLAHGIPARVGRLRGYGNAIVPPLAAEFIKAYQEVMLGTCDNAWLAKE